MHKISVILCVLVVFGKSISADAKKQCDQSDLGRQLQCLGSRYEANNIPDAELEDELFNAMNKLPSNSRFYSIGYEYGNGMRITAGYQDHYRFTSKMSLGLSDVDFFSSKQILSAVPSQRKSRIEYGVIENAEELKNIDPLTSDTAVKSGDALYRNTYFVNGWREPRHSLEKCTKMGFDHQDKFNSVENVLVIVPADVYCDQDVVTYKAEIRKTPNGHEYYTMNPDF